MKNSVLLLLPLLPWLLAGQPLFTRITDPANPTVTFVNTPASYKGVAWIDLDDDNHTDLFVAPRFLFRNEGNGVFTQLGSLPDAPGQQPAAGASWADADNDGDPDCILAQKVSQFYRQTPAGFEVASADLPADFADYSAWDAAFGDADRDGRLDMVLVHAANFHPTGPYPCRLYRQQPDGTFASVTGYAFTDELGPYTVPAWSDYDLDGDVDLFIASGPAGTPGLDFNYRNTTAGPGAIALQRLLSFPFGEPQDGQTYNFPDYDNDGDLDVCLTNYGGAPNRFYRNNGDGTYTSLSTPFTTTAPHLANAWGDVDNDGDLDVLITRDGSADVEFYRNLGNGTFAAKAVAGTADATPTGLALADYDNDGDLDFYVNGAGAARALFRNDAPQAGDRHWIALTLRGVQSNASGLGARVRVRTVIGGAAVWQQREVSARNSFMSQNDLRVHVGLDLATTVDSIEVHWPSGQVDVATALAADAFYRVTEGQGITVTATSEPAAGVPLAVSPNPIGRAFSFAAEPAPVRVELFTTAGQLLPLTWTASAGRVDAQLAEDLPFATYFVRAYWSDGRVGQATVVAF
jgi:hypothetical protein